MPRAHLLVQAELREVQKQHKTKPRPANQRRRMRQTEPEVLQHRPPPQRTPTSANFSESRSFSSVPQPHPVTAHIHGQSHPSSLAAPPLTCPPISPSLRPPLTQGKGGGDPPGSLLRHLGVEAALCWDRSRWLPLQQIGGLREVTPQKDISGHRGGGDWANPL